MKAYAKINLGLDVLDKREDGYHNLNSVMQQIDLFDELSFEENDDVIIKSKYKDEVILKVAAKLKELFAVDKGVKVDVTKNIPVCAGFGSASTNAAAALVALNQIWDLNLNSDQLVNIGAEIGADVPFCLVGGCCLVSGKGEVVKKIRGMEMDLVLVNPGYGISTKDAYAKIDNVHFQSKHSSLALRDAKDTEGIANNIYNDFIHIQDRKVKEIMADLKSNGALNASITGKGPTVFGIFGNPDKAFAAQNALKDKYDFVYKTKTIK